MKFEVEKSIDTHHFVFINEYFNHALISPLSCLSTDAYLLFYVTEVGVFLSKRTNSKILACSWAMVAWLAGCVGHIHTKKEDKKEGWGISR